MMSTREYSAMTCLSRLMLLSLCSLLLCCDLQQKAQSAQSENANTPVSPSDLVTEQFGDNKLLTQLHTEQGIQKPFAWWSSDGGKEKGGTVIGLDRDGRLKRVEFIRTTNGYIVRSSEQEHQLNVPIVKSGDLELSKYIPDTEFPFRSFIVSSGGCNTHFVLVWRALNRSFESRSKEAVFLDAIDLRLIVEREGAISSNQLIKLLLEGLDKTLAEDVNNDRKPDFLLVGWNMSTSIRIWTVDGCDIRSLLFKEDDHFLESLADKGLSATKNQATGCYDVSVVHREPITQDDRVFFEVTKTIYRWDRTDAVYKPAETTSKREAGNR